MIVRREFKKLEGSTIRCSLEVLQAEDFPTQKIFSGSGEVFIAKDTFAPLYDEISKEGALEELLEWSNQLLSEIREQLTAWRAAEVPSPENFHF